MLLQIVFIPTVQYSVMSHGENRIWTNILNWNTLNSGAFFFYNDDYSIGVNTDESIFSYI